MPLASSVIQKQYTIVLAAYVAAFPHLTPPDATWWRAWFRDHDYHDILEAIQKLQNYPPQVQSRYTTISTGKAITSMLATIAIRRAIPNAPIISESEPRHE